MKPILFPSTATTFTSQGLGVLSDCISCVVREERNGEYELTLQYPVGGIHYDEIEDRAIIYAKPSPYRNPQPFRIYLSESPINGIVTFHAHHLSYDLSGIPVEPFTAGTCASALSGLVTNSVCTNPFTTDTDKSVTGTFKLSTPKSFRSCLGGEENSILDVYGTGEYEFDKYSVYLHLHRGSDNGVKIAYGKNLTDFNMERNLENIITGVYPYWANIDENTVVTLSEKVIPIYDVNNPAYLLDSGGNYLLDSDGKYLLVLNPFPFDNILPLDLSLEFEEQPSEEELRAKASKYITDNQLGVPRVSIEVSFVDLAGTEEYKDLAVLEQVDLCDAVTVEFPIYGISVKAKVVAIETDVLMERYNQVTIGNYRYTIADTLANLTMNQVTKEEVKVGNQQASDYINNTKGTFEFLDNGDGTNSGFTIYKNGTNSWLRCTAGGLGLSSDGGLTYTNAITENGVIASVLDVQDEGNSMLKISKMGNGYPQMIMYSTRGNRIFDLFEWSSEVGSNDEGVEFHIYNPEENMEIITMGTGYDTDTGEMSGTHIRIDAPDATENNWGIALYAQNSGESGLMISRNGDIGTWLGYDSAGDPIFKYDGYYWEPRSISINGVSYRLLIGVV